MVEGFGSLCEVRDLWTLDELFDAHEILDEKRRQEAEATARIRRGAA